MLELFEYKLPFRNLFKTGSAEFRNRKGILIRFREKNTDFITEASPLPGFSGESFSEVKQALINQKKYIDHFLDGELSLQKIRDLTTVKALDLPSVQFSLSFLGLSILAHRREKTIHDLLGQEKPRQLQINDVIGYGPIPEMRNNIKASVEKGFRTLKIKTPDPGHSLAELLTSIHKDYPEVHFRLDANRSWQESELEQICEIFQHLPIEYVEEPCRLEDLSELEEIQKKMSLPVALDESVSTIKELKEVLIKFPDLILIIKPFLIGNFLEIHETISEFRSCFKQIVVTTTLESKIGRSTIASAASLIGDQQMSHGLHTGHLLADDLLPDFEVENGSIINLRENPARQLFSQIETSFLKNLG